MLNGIKVGLVRLCASK